MNEERRDATQSTEGGLSTADVAYGRRQEPGVDEPQRPAPEEGRTEGAREQAATPLFPPEHTSRYQERWQSIQTKFVDEPQTSAKEADSLVAEVIQQLASRFAEEREQLEKAWSSGSDVSTEDLRQALQHYRSFFQRLLSA